MSPYKYKDSGFDWIGRIPSDWPIKRVKFNTYIKARVGWHGLTSAEHADSGPYLVTGTDFIDGRVKWDTCYHVNEERYEQDPYIQLKEEDLLITKDGSIGKVALVKDLDGKATLNSGVFVTRPRNKDYITNYLFWILQSHVFTGFIDYIKTGSTINHLYQETFSNFLLPLPSLQEQEKISKYVSIECARIDGILKKYQNAIEILNEKRISIISNVVTKGLNPSVKMKDSGVEWIGEIPAHWDVKKIKYATTLRSKKVNSLDVPYRYIGLENIESWTGRLIESDVPVEKEGTSNKFEIGDVLFNKLRPYLAKCFKADFEGICTSELLVLKPILYKNDYLKYLLLSDGFIKIVDSSTYGAKMPRANWNFVGSLFLCIPPQNEQDKIVSFLDTQLSGIDNLIAKINKQIELLREHKEALITNVVTGKVDVREESVVC